MDLMNTESPLVDNVSIQDGEQDDKKKITRKPEDINRINQIPESDSPEVVSSIKRQEKDTKAINSIPEDDSPFTSAEPSVKEKPTKPSKTMAGKIVKRIPLTEEQIKEQQRVARAEYDSNLLVTRQKRQYNQPLTPEEEKLRTDVLQGRRIGYSDSVRQQKEKLKSEGYTQEKIDEMYPASYQEGLQGKAGQNVTLDSLFDSRAIQPTDVEQLGTQQVVKDFGASSLWGLDKFQGLSGQAIRRKAAELHLSAFKDSVGLSDEEVTTALNVAEKRKGNSLFVTYKDDGSEEPVEVIEDVIDKGGDYVYDEASGRDLVRYNDKKAELLKIALVTKLAGSDETKANQILDKIDGLLNKDKEELDKETEYYRQSIEKNEIGTWDAVVAGLKMFINPKEEWGGNEESTLNFAEKILGSGVVERFTNTGDVAVGRDRYSSDITDEQKKSIESLNSLVKYQRSERLNGLFQAVGRIPNIDYLALANPFAYGVIKKFAPQAQNYIPNTQTATATTLQFGQGSLPFGAGILATLADIEASVKYRDPKTYYSMLISSAVTMGASRLVPKIGTALVDSGVKMSPKVVPATQAGLQVAQTISNYYINREGYLDPKGNFDIQYFVRDALIDVGASGIDVKAIFKAKSPDVVPTNMYNIVFRNEETGKFMAFTQDVKTKLMTNFEVSEQDAQKWMDSQVQAKRQFVFDTISNDAFNVLYKNTASPSNIERFKSIITGVDIPVTDEQKATSKALSPTVRSKEKIVDGQVVTTEKTYNPLAVVNDDGSVETIKSNATVGQRLNDLPDDNRQFSTLALLDETDAPLNIKSNLLGDSRVLPTMRDLESNGYVIIEPNGNLRLTDKGSKYSKQLGRVNEKFQKLVETQQDEYGANPSPKKRAEINEQLKDNPDWTPEKTEQIVNIQDIQKMNLKQRASLAIRIALGDMDYNPDTGIAQNTSFTRKYNDRTYDFGRKGREDSKLLDLAKTINAGKPKVADREAIDIVKNRGLDETPENIQKVKDEALDKLEQLRDMPDIGGVVKVKGLKNNFEEDVDDSDINNADTLAPADNVLDTETSIKPTNKDTLTIEHKGGNSHTYRYDESIDAWTDINGTGAITDKTLKSKVNAGDLKVIGKVPDSWNKVRQMTKDTYKSQNSEVKKSLIPKEVSKEEARQFYKDEANVLNLAVFGHTAEQWRKANPTLGNSREKNVRDFRTNHQDLVLANMTKLNEKYISKGMPQDERIIKLNTEARKQLKALEEGKYKPVSAEKVDKPVKVKESKAIAKILKGADEGTVEKIQNAVRGGKTKQASKLIREIAGEDASLSTINALYNKIQTTVLSSDLEMAEASFVNKTLGNLTLERPELLTAKDHAENILSWIFNEGKVKTVDGHILDLSDNKWKGFHIEQSVNDKTAFYVSDEAMSVIRAINGQKNNVAGFVPMDRVAFTNSLVKFAETDDRLKPFAKQLRQNTGFVSIIKVSPEKMSYGTFSGIQVHEGTHKIVLSKVGTSLTPDHTRLENIFNHKDGQLIRMSLNDHYSGKSNNVIAHEVLAFATNPDDFDAFFKGEVSPELVDAFVNTYDKLLRAIRDANGDEAEKHITRYTNDEVKKSVIEIRNNERRITEDSVQSTQDRYRESENIIARGVSSDDSEKTVWRGSGIKRFKARRYTTTGNPLDLTNVAGAETQRLKQAGALPSINMFVETPDGKFALEKPFKAEIFKPFEIEGEFNIADMNTDPVVQKLFEDNKFDYPKFQSELEKLGYDGVYNSYEDIADAFRYRVQLFRNDANVTRLTEMQSLDMYQNAGKRIYENLMKSPQAREWMKDGAVQEVLFHGTRADIDFKTFDPPTIFREFGTHLGTVRQAHDFIKNIKSNRDNYKDYLQQGLTREQAILKLSDTIFRKDNFYASDRVIPVITNVKNPYRVPDTQWYSGLLITEIKGSDITLDNLINAYLKNPEVVNLDDFIKNRTIDYVTKEVERNKIDGIDNAKEYLFSSIDDDSTYTRATQSRQFVIDLLAEMGYDSLVYKNLAEGVKQKTVVDSKFKTKTVTKVRFDEVLNYPVLDSKVVVDTYKINQYDDSYLIFDSNQIKMALSPEFDTFFNSDAELTSLDMAESPLQRKDIQEVYRKNPNKVSVDEMQKVLEEGTWSKIKIPTDRIKDLEKDLQKFKLKYKADYDSNEFVVMYDNPENSKLVNIFRDKYKLDSVVHSDAGKVTLDNADGTIKQTVGVNVVRNDDVDGDASGNVLSMSDGNLQFDVDFSKADSEKSIDLNESSTLDMYSKSDLEKITSLDKKLADSDYDAWTHIAESSMPEGLLTTGELRTIKKLSDAKDLTGLQNFVVNLNRRSIIELAADFSTVGLLGLRTIGKNVIGNTQRQILDEIVRIPHSVIDMVGAKLLKQDTNDTASSFITNPAITAKAIGEGLLDGITKGIPSAFRIMKGTEASNFEHPLFARDRTVGANLFGVNWLRIPEDFTKYAWRLQGALDRPFGTYAYRRAMSEIISLKQKEAKKQGITLSKNDVLSNLPESDYEIARDAMLNASFQGSNLIADYYANKTEGLSPTFQAILRFPIKFVKTPLNVVDYMLSYSYIYPALKLHVKNRGNDVDTVKKDYFDFKKTTTEIFNNPKDRKVITEAIAKGLVGTAMIYAGYRLREEGILMPMYDEKDGNEREQMEAKGTSYGTMNVGGYNIDLSWMNPTMFYMLAGASVYEDGKKYDDKVTQLEQKLSDLESVELEFQEPEKIEKARAELDKAKASSPFMSVTNRVLANLASQTPFLRQAMDVAKKGVTQTLLDTYAVPDQLIPQFVGDVAKTIDPVKRVKRNDSWLNNKIDKIKDKVPYLSQTLDAESTMLGDDVSTGYGFDPMKTNKINTDALPSELDRLNVSITTKPTGNKLIDNKMAREKGKFIKPYLEKTISSEEYNNVSDERKTSMLRDIIFNTNKMRTEKEPQEKINYKVDLLKDMHYTAQLLKSNDKSLSVDKITDKDTIRDIIRAGIDTSKLDTQSILRAIGKTDKDLNIFLRSMYNYHFFNDKNPLVKSKQKFEEFKADRGARLISQYVNRLDRAESTKRIEKWKSELIQAGETDEAKIDAIVKSKSIKYGKSKSKQYEATKEIIIPKATNLADIADSRNYGGNNLPIDGMPIEYPDSPDKWKGQRPSQNIIDAREGSTYLNIENTIFEGTDEDIEKLSNNKKFLKLTNAERERLIENIDNVLKSDADTMENKTKTALTSLRKRIILD